MINNSQVEELREPKTCLGVYWESNGRLYRRIRTSSTYYSVEFDCNFKMKREILKQSWSEKGILHSPENSCLYQFEGRDAKQRQKLTKYNEMHY